MIFKASTEISSNNLFFDERSKNGGGGGSGDNMGILIDITTSNSILIDYKAVGIIEIYLR